MVPLIVPCASNDCRNHVEYKSVLSVVKCHLLTRIVDDTLNDGGLVELLNKSFAE